MQKVKIPITQKGKQRPLCDIIREICDLMDSSQSDSACGFSPESLVSKEILHKFDVDGEERWYTGHVGSYNAVTHLHEVAYEEEDEIYFFNLFEDISNGDLVIVNDT